MPTKPRCSAKAAGAKSVSLAGRKPSFTCVDPFTPRPASPPDPPRPNRGDGRLDVVARRSRTRRGMREARQALGLVALEEVHADSRPGPEHADHDDRGHASEQGKLRPRRPGDD